MPSCELLRSHNDRRADLRASSAIAVPNARVEVDRVAGIERMGVRADGKVDLAANHVQEFHARVLVHPLLVGGDGLKLG